MTTQEMKQEARLPLSGVRVVENFKPGRMKAMGMDYEALSKRNPRLIYVSHKGFLNGPYENRLALDEVVQMMAGLAYMTGPVGRPLRAGSSVNDIMGGKFGAIGVLAALNERWSTGMGKEVQSALFENGVLLSAQHVQQYVVTGEPAAPMPERISAWAVYDVFELANKEQLFIAIVFMANAVNICVVAEDVETTAQPDRWLEAVKNTRCQRFRLLIRLFRARAEAIDGTAKMRVGSPRRAHNPYGSLVLAVDVQHFNGRHDIAFAHSDLFHAFLHRAADMTCRNTASFQLDYLIFVLKSRLPTRKTTGLASDRTLRFSHTDKAMKRSGQRDKNRGKKNVE